MINIQQQYFQLLKYNIIYISLIMIVLNVIVFLLYILLIIITLIFSKLAISSKTHTTQITNLSQVSSNQNKIITLIKYLGYRYTILSVVLQEKKYILTQILSISVYSICLLQINKITLWPMMIAPFSLFSQFCLNQIPELIYRLREQQKQIKQIKVISENIIQVKDIFYGIFISIMLIMQITSTIRIYYSVSNLGQLNILSTLTIIVCDFFVIRPIIILIIGLVIKLMEKQNQQIYFNRLLSYFLISEYLRTNDFQLMILPMQSSSPLKKQQFSPSKVPKAKQTYKQIDQITSIELLKIKQTYRQNQLDEMKIQDIYLKDKIFNHEPNESIIECIKYLKNQTQIKSQEKSEPNHCNKQNLDIYCHKTKAKQLNQDIYLAQNFYQTKNEQTLPVNINFSPVKQKKKTQQNKNKRILMLNGNSPYLQYLPNMLKKQQSQHRFKSKQKQREKDKSIIVRQNMVMKSVLHEIRK